MLNSVLGKGRRKLLFYALLFVLFAAAGFASFTIMTRDESSSDKKPQSVARQFASAQPQLAVAPAVPLAPAQVPASGGPEARQKVDDPCPAQSSKHASPGGVSEAKGRDVFKEFYIKRVSTGTKGFAEHLERGIPDLTRLMNPNATQLLPSVQQVNASAEETKEVKIYGITCARQSKPEEWECAAITSEGVLKKGDKLGSDTVLNVDNTSFATSRKNIELN